MKVPTRLPSTEEQAALCVRYPVEPVRIAQETLHTVARSLPKFGPHPLLRRIVLKLVADGHYDGEHEVFVCPQAKLREYSGLSEMSFRKHLKSSENLMRHLSYLSDGRMIGAAADFGLARRLQSEQLFELSWQARADRSVATAVESIVVDALSSKEIKANKKASRKQTMEARRNEARAALVSDAEFIAEYLNSRPGRRFTEIVRRNIRSAVGMLKAMDARSAVKLTIATQLDGIAKEPWVAYGASKDGNSCRLFAGDASYMYLKREIRQELLKGWIEYDMRACQLAIVAKDWGVESVQELLADDENDPYLVIADGVLDHRDDVKAAVIRAVFGMPVAGIRKFLTTKIDKAVSDVVLDNPYFVDLLAARDRQTAKAIEQGHLVDCYGRRYTVTDKESARSALACCAQAREMNLIRPAYDVADKAGSRMSINVHLHDGFVAGFKDDSEQRVWGGRAIDAVSARCLELGYQTRLRCKG